MHVKKTAFFASALAAVWLPLSASGCGRGEHSPAEELTKIYVSETEIEISEGETFRLTVRFEPQPDRMPEVEWQVSDGEIAGVERGMVTGKKAGETIVTVRTESSSAACRVTVSPVG